MTNKVSIWDLFAGYERAHGRYNLSKQRTTDRGKVEGRALTIREPVTEQLWQDHLAGQGAGLGIIPLRADNTVLWACIDIDVYNLDLGALEEKIKTLQLPLVLCRTKSGGAHCFLFFREPTPAVIVRPFLETWAAALGYGGAEVFPKQTSRYDEEHDLGNWLNMPYYHAVQSLRYGIKDGKPLSLDEFVAYAEEKAVDELAPESAPTATISNSGIFEEGPPCLQRLYSLGGFPDGTRNEGLYNVAVYLRKKYPDNWKDKLTDYNAEMCHPPLSLGELNTIAKSVGRKKYDYRCKLPPIAPYCQRSLCQSRACGIGETIDNGESIEIGSLTKYDGEPTLWFFEVGGVRLMLNTKELTNQTLFREALAERAQRYPPPVPGPRWAKFIDDKIRSADVIKVPLEATPTGQFQLLVRQFLTGMAQATSKDELVSRHTPFDTGDGEIWFRSRGLLDYLNNHGFRYKSENHVWQMLREMGCRNDFIKVKGQGVNIWILPKPEQSEDDTPLPEFGTKEF